MDGNVITFTCDNCNTVFHEWIEYPNSPRELSLILKYWRNSTPKFFVQFVYPGKKALNLPVVAVLWLFGYQFNSAAGWYAECPGCGCHISTRRAIFDLAMSQVELFRHCDKCKVAFPFSGKYFHYSYQYNRGRFLTGICRECAIDMIDKRQSWRKGDRAIDIQHIYEAQKGKCWWCGKDVGDDYHVDHRIPLARGGREDVNNLVISCPRCNLSKNDKMPWEWIGRLL